MVKAVIFDIGGVLVNHDQLTSRYIADKFALDEDIVSDYFDRNIVKLQVGQLTEEDFWHGLRTALATHPIDFSNIFYEKYKSDIRLNEDVLNQVRQLRGSGYLVATLSNTIEPHVNYLRESGVLDPFHENFLSYEVGLIKPQKEIYHHALDSLGVSANDTIFIDDHLENVYTADSLGMRGINFVDAEDLDINLRKNLTY